jgi:hypothetical protein
LADLSFSLIVADCSVFGCSLELGVPHSDHKVGSLLEYLALCGAVPISVIERDGMCSIRAGGDDSSAQWWVDRQKAVLSPERPAGSLALRPTGPCHGSGAQLCGLARRDADACAVAGRGAVAASDGA